MNALLYLLQVTLSLAVFYGFYYIALRKETLFEANRIYLLCTLLLSLVLPFVNFSIIPEVIQPTMMSSIVFLESTAVSFSEELSTTALNNFHLSDVLLVGYVLVMGFMTSKLLIAFKKIERINKTASTVIIKDTTCLISEEVKSPFSFFRTIYLPQHYTYQEDELEEVIAHEKTHVEEYHSWDVLLIELVSIVLWIIPFIYLYKKALAEVHEYLADKAVLRISPWETYAQLLVNQQYRQLPNALAHQLIYSQLKNRLQMMTKSPSTITARLKYLGILPVALMTMMLVSFNYPDTINAKEDVPMETTVSVTGDSDLPIFPGCETENIADQQSCSAKKLNEYIGDNLVFPKSMEKEGIQGKVIAKFIVDSEGRVKDVTIAKSLHADADLAVLSLLIGMNEKIGQWAPATKDGKAVDAIMHLPVVFKY